ncbi:MAG: flippase [Myxococcales bacterium]|jgi:O-antigen/teichoic acid export membrane protein
MSTKDLVVRPPAGLPARAPVNQAGNRAAAEGAAAGSSASDALLAVRNAFKLTGSLLATWGIALVVRILLPRLLGPEQYGPLNFADAFATLFFVSLGLGVDTYIRKEIPVRPAHASDFFGGVLVLRLAMAGLVVLAMSAVMGLTGRPPAVRQIVYIFAGWQFLFTLNNSLAALLQAKGNVDGLSVMNIASKLMWGAGILAALLLRSGLAVIASCYVAAEAVKALALGLLARKHLGLKLRPRLAPALSVIAASLPFYLHTVSQTAYARLDVSLLSILSNNDREVGWYGAASNLAGLTLLVTPLISWVLLPHFARAAARSQAELDHAIRRSIELVLSVAIPTSLLMALGADVWIALMFGPEYAPAALDLSILAPVFILTYVATITASSLVLLGRGWTLTLISIVGLIVSVCLNLLLIPLGLKHLGPAGGGAGCAASLILTEATVTGLMLWTIRGRAFDRRSLAMLGKTAGVCAVVVLVDRVFGDLGAMRVAIDAAVYFGLAIAVGALRLGEMYRFARSAFRRRASAPA